MSSITLSARLEKSKIALGRKHKLHLLVNLEGKKLEGKRKPLCLGVAIDLSTSMSGRKVEDAKNGLVKLVDQMTDEDVLAIVAFSDSVWVVLEPTKMTSDVKDRIKGEIRAMRVVNSTNISGATFETYEQVKAAAKAKLKDAVSRALLFTDGCPTSGITDQQELVAIAKKHPEDTSLICFGYGDDYNAELMKSMSRAAGGDAYHIKTPDEFGPTLGRVLGGLVSCVAQKVKLTVKTKPDVKILEVLNDFDVKGSDDQTEAIVTVDDVYSEEKRGVLMELELPEMDKSGRPFKLGTATIEYQDLLAKEPRSHEIALEVEYVKEADEDKAADKEVAEKIALIKAAKAQEEAIKLAQAGQFAQAKSVIRSASLSLQGVGTHMASLAAHDLEDNVQCYLSQDAFQAGGAHYLHSNASSYKRGRGQTLGASKMYNTSSQSDMEKQFGGGVPPGAVGIGPLGGASVPTVFSPQHPVPGAHGWTPNVQQNQVPHVQQQPQHRSLSKKRKNR